MFSSNSSTVSGDANYIEDVFSTYLYTGTNSTQTIPNGIDLAGKGGLTWIKRRTDEAHYLFDTNRGALAEISTSATEPSEIKANSLTSFNADGFSLGSWGGTNYSVAPNNTYASWTFRKQPKFFDVVTYTGNGVAGVRSFAHSLASVPGFIIIKDCTNTNPWIIYHRSITAGSNMEFTTGTTYANGYFSTAPTSTVFSVDSTASTATTNVNGATYVAYLYAHDAGGFGLAGTDNVISCGNYTGVAYPNSQEVNVGFEPQWVMIKNTTTASGWSMWDSMRGMAVVPAANVAQAQLLEPNTTAAEGIQPGIYPTATGFVVKNGLTAISGLGDNFIYIAIRRGPMKVPTDGTKVYNAIARTGTGAAATVTGVGFTPDWLFTKSRSDVTGSMVADRLRGAPYLQTTSTNAEANNSAVIDATAFSTTMDGFRLSASSTLNNWDPYTYINYLFKRAPGFFDEVCYTGTGGVQVIPHNLTVLPELIITKHRSATSYGSWYTSYGSFTKYMLLQATDAEVDVNGIFSTPTATNFTMGYSGGNETGAAFVAYLFATCPGVSKVGSYTGTGTTQTINCGFAAGARFVMVKATSTTGDWIVVDTARGLVSGNDPTLALNSTAAEVTTNDWFDPYSAGFELSSAGGNLANTNGVSYIFLAIS